jgi:DNA-binding transcriptional ArsR family regulator
MLHPVRARILAALHRADRTAAALASELADVPTGSLYRHLEVLQRAKLVRVVGREPGVRQAHAVYGIERGPELLTGAERGALDAQTIPIFVGQLARIVEQAAADYAGGLDGPMPEGGATFVLKHVMVEDSEWESFRAQVRQLVGTAGRKPAPALRRKLVAVFGFPAPDD